MTAVLDLSGRVAVVTGASRGIGYHIARQLAAAGAHVVAVARTVGGLEELDDEIKSAGGQATLVPLDLTDMPGIDRLGGAIFERWGKLDIMVANAGILGVISPIGHVEAKVFEKVMAINVTGTWRLDSLAGAAARQIGRRTRHLAVFRRRPYGARFLEPVCCFEVGGRNAGQMLGGRDEGKRATRQLGQSGRDAHRHARPGHAR